MAYNLWAFYVMLFINGDCFGAAIYYGQGNRGVDYGVKS